MEQVKSEFELIEWIAANRFKVDPQDVPVDIGDDMAVFHIAGGGGEMLITTDMLLEGVHFDLTVCSPQQVGYKAMAVSLSDCAAMAAKPFAAVVAVALPNDMSFETAKQLHAGIDQAARKYNCPLIGGDTTSWAKPLAMSITMLAKATAAGPILRSGAKPSDAMLVTGELGGSLAGRHMAFAPRLAEAKLLSEMVELHAMIDISDGLASDLRHICRKSNVKAIIDAAAIPIGAAAKDRPEPLAAALTDGEDFELLFCVSRDDADRLLADWPKRSDVPLSLIGEIVEADPTDENRMLLRQQDGSTNPLKLRGWEHHIVS